MPSHVSSLAHSRAPSPALSVSPPPNPPSSRGLSPDGSVELHESGSRQDSEDSDDKTSPSTSEVDLQEDSGPSADQEEADMDDFVNAGGAELRELDEI